VNTQAMRLVKTASGYMHIKPAYKNLLVTEDVQNYNSKLNPLSKDDLQEFMNNLKLI